MTTEQATGVHRDGGLKDRHRAMWAAGDYPSMVETFLAPLGPRLVEAAGVGPGDAVLDVAAGTGNVALRAAERGARVTASDLTPELLDAGRARAEALGLELQWVTADAEHLPFADSSFDVVLSAIGVMFAPDHQQAADELVRVCRPGGTIGVLSWTPTGSAGGLFAALRPFAPPPPPGAQPPVLWGEEEHVRELLDGTVDVTRVERDVLRVDAFRQPVDIADHFRRRFGPAVVARARAGGEGRMAAFDEALERHWADANRSADGEPARFALEHLLVVGRRR